MNQNGLGRQFILYRNTAYCNNGYVTSTCPFTVGLGLNEAYLGDAIVYLDNPGNGVCIGGKIDVPDYAVVRNCPPNGNDQYGDEWVECGNQCTSSISGIVSGFVSVALSNYDNKYRTIELEQSEEPNDAVWDFTDIVSGSASNYNWNYCTTC